MPAMDCTEMAPATCDSPRSGCSEVLPQSVATGTPVRTTSIANGDGSRSGHETNDGPTLSHQNHHRLLKRRSDDGKDCENSPCQPMAPSPIGMVIVRKPMLDLGSAFVASKDASVSASALRMDSDNANDIDNDNDDALPSITSTNRQTEKQHDEHKQRRRRSMSDPAALPSFHQHPMIPPTNDKHARYSKPSVHLNFSQPRRSQAQACTPSPRPQQASRGRKRNSQCLAPTPLSRHLATQATIQNHADSFRHAAVKPVAHSSLSTSTPPRHSRDSSKDSAFFKTEPLKQRTPLRNYDAMNRTTIDMLNPQQTPTGVYSAFQGMSLQSPARSITSRQSMGSSFSAFQSSGRRSPALHSLSSPPRRSVFASTATTATAYSTTPSTNNDVGRNPGPAQLPLPFQSRGIHDDSPMSQSMGLPGSRSHLLPSSRLPIRTTQSNSIQSISHRSPAPTSSQRMESSRMMRIEQTGAINQDDVLQQTPTMTPYSHRSTHGGLHVDTVHKEHERDPDGWVLPTPKTVDVNRRSQHPPTPLSAQQGSIMSDATSTPLPRLSLAPRDPSTTPALSLPSRSGLSVPSHPTSRIFGAQTGRAHFFPSFADVDANQATDTTALPTTTLSFHAPSQRTGIPILGGERGNAGSSAAPMSDTSPIPNTANLHFGRRRAGSLSSYPMQSPGQRSTVSPHFNNSLNPSASSSPWGKQQQQPAIRTQSLLTPSRSNSVLKALASAREREKAETADIDSLTDSDDDGDDFVLSTPNQLGMCSVADSGADASRGVLFIPRSASRNDGAVVADYGMRMPLNRGRTSCASLIGTDFVHDPAGGATDESMAETRTANAPSFVRDSSGSPTNPQPMDDSDRNREHSIGLAIETDGGQDVDDEMDAIGGDGYPRDHLSMRDLVTPPAVLPAGGVVESPPARPGPQPEPSQSSVYISRANASAVNLTIAQMAFDAHRHEAASSEGA